MARSYRYKARIVVEATFEAENNAQAFEVQSEIASHLSRPSQWPPSHSGVSLNVECPPEARRLYAIRSMEREVPRGSPRTDATTEETP